MQDSLAIDIIEKSPLFNKDWYHKKYTDVRLTGLPAAEHFFRFGAVLGRDPGPSFSTKQYLAKYPDVVAARVNPLLHYECTGRTEGRKIICSEPKTISDYAVIVHAYHPDTFPELQRYLNCFPGFIDRYVSYPESSERHSDQIIRKAFPGCTPIKVKNVGQDVGAFVQTLARIRNRPYKFFCKIHSKGGDKLPEVWRSALLDGTVGTTARVAQFEKIFREQKDVLVGGSKELFLHGPSYLMGNTANLDQLLKKTGLQVDYKARDWGFFAGTFFWMQASLAEQILDCVAPDDFSEEAVKRDGQVAHAVERLFGILPHALGGKVALASSVDERAAISILSDFPADAPHEKRLMVDTLTEIKTTRDEIVANRKTNALGFDRIYNETQRQKIPTEDFAIITPTGDRISAFNRCVQMVCTQTVQPKEWIIVDDGMTPLTDLMRLPDWATYVRRERGSDDPPHTLSVNVLEALKHVTCDRVVIVEDDDWYSPVYIEYLLAHLDHHDMVGLNTIRYYHLLENYWKHGRPPKHTAFAQTAFKGAARDHLEDVCKSNTSDIREKGIVDRYWWQTFEGNKKLLQDHPVLHVGLKGGFGRPGLAEGHKRTDPDYKGDGQQVYLKQNLGADSFYYNRWQKKFKKPYAIYTSIAGDYDNLKEPIAEMGDFDFFAFSDTAVEDPGPWENIPFDQHWDDPVRTAKKPKILPHLYFPDYEWSLWIDANIFILQDLNVFIRTAIENNAPVALFEHPERNTLRGEVTQLCKLKKDDPDLIQKQFDGYVAEGWDNQLPLFECNFIIRRHNDPAVSKAMTMWWNEISTNSRRDQVSFPYTMWKSGITPLPLRPKGKSTRNIPEVYYPTKPPHGLIRLEDVRERIEQHASKIIK